MDRLTLPQRSRGGRDFDFILRDLCLFTLRQKSSVNEVLIPPVIQRKSSEMLQQIGF